MSENRSRYSTAPLQNLKRRPPRQPQQGTASKNASKAPAGSRSFVFLQVMLVAVLPAAFLLSLIIKDTRFYWVFVAVSLLCLGIMVLLKAFVPNARRVLGVIHAAMIAVALFAILVTAPPIDRTAVQQTQDLASIFSENSSANLVDMNLAQNESQSEQQSVGSASLAQKKLEQFMAAWGSKDYASMVSYSAPNWVNQRESQQEAETAIFHLSAIRTPLDYQILDVSGNDSDQTRTITMQATISKNDGRDPQKYNFQILMIRSNNEWYVDPNSISSSQIVQQATLQATQQPTTGTIESAVQQQTMAGVRSDTILYYNQDGGEFYHIDPNCSSIGEKYRPLTAMFYYRDVSNDTFKNLKTCPVCKAPAR